MSSPVLASAGGSGSGASCSASSRPRRAASLRRASINRRVATADSHARGSCGGCSGHDAQRLDERLLQRVLGSVEVLAAADEPREHLGDEGAQVTLVRPGCQLVRHAGQSDARPVMTSRTSIHS